MLFEFENLLTNHPIAWAVMLLAFMTCVGIGRGLLTGRKERLEVTMWIGSDRGVQKAAPRLVVRVMNIGLLPVTVESGAIVVRLGDAQGQQGKARIRLLALAAMTDTRPIPFVLREFEVGRLVLNTAQASQFGDATVEHAYVVTGSGLQVRTSRLHDFRGEALDELLSRPRNKIEGLG